MALTKLCALLSVVLVLSSSTSVQGLVHYPPANTSITDLTAVLNGHGAPGIYNTSHTPDDEYGIYNWCNMPHVRKTEYKVPSKEYSLKYLEVIQRHRKRTPYASNTFFKEDITWDCTDEGPYHYAKDKSKFKTTPIYWQAETGTQNPFEYTVGPGFVNSTCQFPDITSEGLEDSKQHGQDFRGVYGDLLQFLPLSWEKNKYQFRVTNNVITTQTLSGFAAGIYPDVDEYFAYIQSDSYDSLEPALSCSLAETVVGTYQGPNTTWSSHLDLTSALSARFRNVSGIEPNDTAGWNTSWDHPYDNLSAKQCHSKPLPCSVNDTSICIGQEDANEIYRLGNWEYAYRWRGAENSTLYSTLIMGPWFKELQGHFKNHLANANQIKYYHNFAHDESISAVLGVLQIDEPVWPGMGSEIVFELWENTSNKTNHIRVLWRGQPLKTSTPLGTIDMLPLDTFLSYLNETIADDLVGLCASG
ncbi:phosphoglycerate mutase-like protein [Naematelia encephala]|uniref:Phosphoglycerate mutase-like protein n=1 Tax=Naematelia encephala TaxID=71784 RepID=A0A1Y2ALC4_9TREE|nr:phosphoglycerate mutase-like protein [Naematelia encephala]